MVPIASTALPARSAQVSGLGSQRSPKVIYYRRDRNIAYFSSRAKNHFYSTFGNLLSHGDSKRDTHQIGIFEFHPWPLVPVVEDHVKTSRLQARHNINGRAQKAFIFHV